jgi:ribosomal protein S11
MMNCYSEGCQEAAALTVQVVGEATTLAYCMHHGQARRQQLDSLLVPFTSTSIVMTDPTEKELLADSYGKLQTVHTENEGLRKAVTRLERELNACDQERQAVKVQLARAVEQIELLEAEAEATADELDRFKGYLQAANELLDLHGIERPGVTDQGLQSGEVEQLPGVRAGADPDSPASKVEGG